MNNSPNNGNSRRPADPAYHQDYNANVGRNPQRRPPNPNGQPQNRPPLTEEERRRIAAARAARARMSGGNPNPGMRPQNPGQNPGARPYPPNGNGNPQARPPQNPGQRPRQEAPLSRRRRRKIRINAGAVLFVLLVGTVIGVSAYQISKNPPVSDGTEEMSRYDSIIQSAQNSIADSLMNGGNGTSAEGAGTPGTSATVPENPAVSEAPVQAGGVAYDTVSVPASSVKEGQLVLVNYNYAYDGIDSVQLKNAYNERTGKIKVSSTTLGMEPEAFDALEQLTAGLVADTGCDDLLLYSGHRTLADQQRIWDSNMTNYGEDYTRTYVAVPGHSEHHTGLACDLGFYTDDGASVPLVDHEFGTWIWEHCSEYGYILRYPAEKAALTGIGHEQWHFRYVGKPHAYAVEALDYCFEEYIEYLKNYTLETQVVHIGTDRTLTHVAASDMSSLTTGWLTYYVPASTGDTTDVRVPSGSDYEISGNNADGFIVTVTLG